MAPAETVSETTLLVGGDARPLTSRVDPACADRPSGCFREAVLQVPLESTGDPWSTLRQLRGHIAPGGVLTVLSGLPARSSRALLRLAGFEPVHEQWASPRLFRARPVSRVAGQFTCTVVVPCKNEAGNVSEAVRRLPRLGTATELIFVDGGSSDGTVEEIEGLIRDHPHRDVRLLRQTSDGGKAAAVFQGFDAASGDILMILDADLTVAPEDLPRFYLALAEGVARLANGDRLAFPMQAGAMPRANVIGNRVFALLLSALTGSALSDTLCGTKALFREDWQRLREIRKVLGGHDPWGDFDLLLGASRLGLTTVDVPVRYYARRLGESKMQPYRHGLALARTCAAAMRASPRRDS